MNRHKTYHSPLSDREASNHIHGERKFSKNNNLPHTSTIHVLWMQGKCLEATYMYMRAKLLQSCRVWLLAILWAVAHQSPLSHGILQARKLEWVAISCFRGSSWPRDQSCTSCIVARFLTSESPEKPSGLLPALLWAPSETDDSAGSLQHPWWILFEVMFMEQNTCIGRTSPRLWEAPGKAPAISGTWSRLWAADGIFSGSPCPPLDGESLLIYISMASRVGGPKGSEEFLPWLLGLSDAKDTLGREASPKSLRCNFCFKDLVRLF